MSTFLNIRIVNDHAQWAQAALAAGELVELRSRHGEIHQGYVRAMQYVMGPDQGWFIMFEVMDDKFLSHPVPPPRRLH